MAGQRRVAALVALVIGTSADRKPFRATVNLTMDLPTALGLRDNPAELAGYGPLPAAMARELAADAGWRRLIHDPLTGQLLDLSPRRYRPSAALADYIRARDRSCIFPGCTRRADTSDLDHAVPHRANGQGGATDRHNLHALCANHHRVKHETGWTLRTRDTGPPTWLSPLGRVYSVQPHDHRDEAAPEPVCGDPPPAPESVKEPNEPLVCPF